MVHIVRILHSSCFTGGIEEDLIKCLADSYIGDFALKVKDIVCRRPVVALRHISPLNNVNLLFADFQGADLRSRGLNRIGRQLRVTC